MIRHCKVCKYIKDYYNEYALCKKLKKIVNIPKKANRCKLFRFNSSRELLNKLKKKGEQTK